MHRERNMVLPKSLIGKAIEYCTKLWSSLLTYLENGNYHIDNNAIENKIRPVAIGRKNYLFTGSHNGAKRTAMFYTDLILLYRNRVFYRLVCNEVSFLHLSIYTSEIVITPGKYTLH